MMRRVMVALERQLLLFPALVTLLVAVALLGGGACAPWQWWLAVALVGSLGFTRMIPGRGLVNAAVFGLLLLGLWIGCGCGWTIGWDDILQYHLPGIRMLIAGWNPVYAPTPEAMQAATGVDPTTLRIYHVLFMAKGTWLFCAAAYFFTGDPFNLFFVPYAFLSLSAAIALWHYLEARHWGWRVAAVLLLLALMPTSDFLVDAVVGYSGVGLLCTLGRSWRTRRWDWLPLLAFSFWMCVSKQTGMLQCFIFWAVFGVAFLWRERALAAKRLAVVAASVTLLVGVVCASPYITSSIHYGHPLYPHSSGDPERHPPYNITADFVVSNDDAAQMGYLGFFCNAYMSSRLTQWYYCWKLNQSTFEPHTEQWQKDRSRSATAVSPTEASTKALIVLGFLLALVCADSAGKLAAVAVLFGLAAFPGLMLGYMRYAAWFAMLPILGLEVVTGFRRRWIRLVGGGVCLLLILAWGIKPILLSAASNIEKNLVMRRLLRQEPPKEVYVTYYPSYLDNPNCITNHFAPFGNRYRLSLANLSLLCREAPALQQSKIVELDPQAADAPKQLNAHKFFVRDEAFRVAPEYDFQRHYPAYMQAVAAGTLTHRDQVLGFPLFCLKAYTVSWAQLLLRWY